VELDAVVGLAVLAVLIMLVALAVRKTGQAHFKEVIDRLEKLESDKEASARIGLQMAETYDASKQLIAGFSAIQGQLTDFANSQRVAGETVTELKSILPAVIAGHLQKVSVDLQDLMASQVLPVLKESLQAMHQALAQERTAAEKRFNELRDGLQTGQREFTAKSAADFAQRSHELDTKLASYRQEVETKLQANVASVQQLIKSIEDRFTTLSNTNTEAINGIRDSVGKQLKEMRDEAAAHRTEMTTITKGAVEGLEGKVTKLTADNNANIEKLKVGVETKLVALQTDNAAKLEEMRKTVDEKLQATLETRLGESFKLVSERLEQVHRGLGEMQTLASGVGDLKRVLTNVKTRGTWGEMQLSRLLEQMLTAEQYAANVTTKKGSNDRVEFAIRLPGKEEDVEVFLPIDAKFPIEDYQRLLDAQDRADLPAIDEAAKALEIRIRGEARTICEKYIDPPNTTDFALLYLPIEGLYAEVLRRPGLVEMLQHDYRVTVAGPTTLTAILNSLQMGFRTLAITKRSSEVWKVLGAVKTEFGKFGDIIDAAKRKIEAASRQFEQVDVRTRAIQRKLRGVEALPVAPAPEMLDVSRTAAGDEDEEDPAESALFHDPGT
jgi:DNA recombination protein RmuC